MGYEENEPFYYQIGETVTILPWWRPNYDRICKFLVQDEVTEILEKYSFVQIIGNCLWDFDVTWDVDIRLITPRIKSLEDSAYWNSVEDDINKLNDLALNQWRLLLDVAVSQEGHTLPTKSEILGSIQKNGKYEVRNSDQILIKISYVKKVVGSKVVENNLKEIKGINFLSLTDRFLVIQYPQFHNEKIVDKIINSKKEILENAITIQEFLEMGEEEFIKFQNY